MKDNSIFQVVNILNILLLKLEGCHCNDYGIIMFVSGFNYQLQHYILCNAKQLFAVSLVQLLDLQLACNEYSMETKNQVLFTTACLPLDLFPLNITKRRFDRKGHTVCENKYSLLVTVISHAL